MSKQNSPLPRRGWASSALLASMAVSLPMLVGFPFVAALMLAGQSDRSPLGAAVALGALMLALGLLGLDRAWSRQGGRTSLSDRLAPNALRPALRALGWLGAALLGLAALLQAFAFTLSALDEGGAGIGPIPFLLALGWAACLAAARKG